MCRFALTRIRIVLLEGEILRIVSMAQVVTRRVGERSNLLMGIVAMNYTLHVSLALDRAFVRDVTLAS
jgi:hypothetical protein